MRAARPTFAAFNWSGGGGDGGERGLTVVPTQIVGTQYQRWYSTNVDQVDRMIIEGC